MDVPGYRRIIRNMAAFAASTIAMAAIQKPVTFNRDVVPILQEHCQSRHRPGQAAPMSLLSYEAARPWAKAIRDAVASRKMPPWFADPRYGRFANDPTLSQSEIDTLVRWANEGALEGDPGDLPTPVQWPKDTWQIQSDVVVSTLTLSANWCTSG